MQRLALVISAQRDYAQAMRDLFNQLGKGEIRVDVEIDPIRAMQISPHAYEIIILDHPIHDMDGLQLLILMKSQAPTTKFVLVEDKPTEQDRMQAYQNGADVVLARPQTPDQFATARQELQRLLKPDEQKQQLVRDEAAPVRLTDLLQTSCLSGDSVLFNVIGSQHTGDIFVYRGEVYHAQYPGRSGVNAFREIIHWDGGLLRVKTFKLNHAPPRTIELTFPQLMEKAEETNLDPQRPATGHLRLVVPPTTASEVPSVAKEAPPLTAAEVEHHPDIIPFQPSSATPLPPLDSHWKVNLIGELMEGSQLLDPERCAFVTHFMYRRLADIAVALDVDYFNSMTFYGPYLQQVLVADNLGIRHAVFETTWSSEALREQYVKWCYEQSL